MHTRLQWVMLTQVHDDHPPVVDPHASLRARPSQRHAMGIAGQPRRREEGSKGLLCWLPVTYVCAQASRMWIRWLAYDLFDCYVPGAAYFALLSTTVAAVLMFGIAHCDDCSVPVHIDPISMPSEERLAVIDNGKIAGILLVMSAHLFW